MFLTAIQSGNKATMIGLVADGIADDRLSLQAAIDATESGATLCLPAGTYRLSRELVINKPIRILGAGPATRVKCDGPIALYVGGAIPNGTPNPGYAAGTVCNLGTGALSVGQVDYTAADPTGIAVGQSVLLALGVDPYDGGQHFLRQWNVVGGIVGNTVTMRFPLSEAVAAFGTKAYAFSPTFHECIAFETPVMGVEIGNLALSSTAATVTQDPLLFVVRARNVWLHDLCISSTPCGCVVIGETDQATVERVTTEQVLSDFVTIYGSRGVTIRDCHAGIARRGIYIENQCRGVRLDNVVLHAPTGRDTSGYVMAMGGSKDVALKGIQIDGPVEPNAHGLIVAEGSVVTQENLTLLGGVIL